MAESNKMKDMPVNKLMIQMGIPMILSMALQAYLQRGGSPTLNDRMLATLCGAKAVELLAAESESKAIGTCDARWCSWRAGSGSNASKVTTCLSA